MYETLLAECSEIEQYSIASGYEIDRLLTVCDIAHDLCDSKTVPTSSLLMSYADVFNDIQMEYGNPFVLTAPMMSGDLNIDIAKMEEAKESIVKRTLKAIKKFIETIFNKAINFFKRLFSYSYRFSDDIKKIREKLKDSKELDSEKLKKTECKTLSLDKYEMKKSASDRLDTIKREYETKKAQMLAITTDEHFIAVMGQIAVLEANGKAYLKNIKKNLNQKQTLFNAGFISKDALTKHLGNLDNMMTHFTANKVMVKELKGDLRDAVATVKIMERNNGKISWKITKLRIAGTRKVIQYFISTLTKAARLNVTIIGMGINAAKKALGCAFT